MITRKKMLQTSAVAAVTILAGNLSAKSHKKESSKHLAIDAALDCSTEAKICLAHCIKEMGDGNKTLAACATSVQTVIAGCEAFVSLAASGSSYAKQMADMCIKMCADCQKECEKHAKHHEECASCAESCKSCIAALKKF